MCGIDAVRPRSPDSVSRESRRHVEQPGGLGRDSRPGLEAAPAAVGAWLVLVRLPHGCLLQARVGADQRISELYRSVAVALGPAAARVVLSCNGSLLSPIGGGVLQQVGIGYGSVVECTWRTRGGMESDGRGVRQQVRDCLSKVQSMKEMVERSRRTISGFNQLIVRVGDAASSGRVGSELQGCLVSQVRVCGGLTAWA